MSSDVRLDDRAFRRQLAEMVERSGMDRREVIIDQSRLFLQSIIKMTPPKTKRMGTDAVEAGIDLAVTALSPQNFTSKSIRAAIQNHRYHVLNKIAAQSPGVWGRGWRARPFEERLHKQARGRDGRVRRVQKVMTPDQQKRKRYIKRKKGNVGILKAGWLPAFAIVDPAMSRVPGWVRKQQKRFGGGVDKTRDPAEPAIEITNRAMGIRRQRSLVNFVLGQRARAMRTRLRHLLRESGRRVGWQPGL